MISITSLYQVTDANDWNPNATDVLGMEGINDPFLINPKTGKKDLPWTGAPRVGKLPPIDQPKQSQHSGALKQGTSFSLEMKDGICLPLTAATLVAGKRGGDLEWCFNACKAKAKAQGKTCDRFIY